MNIKQALQKLDPLDDSHWTAEGLPRMGVVEDLVGDSSINRTDVTNAVPEFNREKAPAVTLSQGLGSLDSVPAVSTDVEKVIVETSLDKDKDEVYQKLSSQATKLKEELNCLTEEFKKAAEYKKGLESRLQKLEASMLEMYPDISNGDAIREYITSQQKIKAQRYSNIKSLMKGIKPEDLRTASPLDTSMKRPTGHGKRKIVYPQVSA